MKIRDWLIKKIVGNKPIIANVTLKLDEYIKAPSSDVMYEKCSISYSDRFQEEMNIHENN